MSLELGLNAKRTIFADSTKDAYQSAGPDFRDVTDFVSMPGLETYNFRKMGRLTAHLRGASQSEVKQSNVTHSLVPAVMGDWSLSVPTDIFDQAKTNEPQEIKKIGSSIGRALKRRETQLVLDQMKAATMASGHTVANTVGATTGMNPDKLTEARAILKANDIDEPICLVYTENQEKDLLRESEFTSADFSASKMLTDGDVKDGHFGYRYKMIGSGRDETGLTLSAGDRSCFAFVPSAVGLVTGLLKSEVNYVPTQFSWLASGMLMAGSAVIDTLGIVEIVCAEPSV